MVVGHKICSFSLYLSLLYLFHVINYYQIWESFT